MSVRLLVFIVCSKTLGKSTYIVMDKDCPAIEPIVEGIYKERAEEEEDIFVTNEEALLLKDKSAMLIVVDVNLPAMTRVSGAFKVCLNDCCS